MPSGNPFRKKKQNTMAELSDDDDYPVSPVINNKSFGNFEVQDQSESNGGWSDGSEDSAEDPFEKEVKSSSSKSKKKDKERKDKKKKKKDSKTKKEQGKPDSAPDLFESDDEEDGFDDLLSSSRSKTGNDSGSNIFLTAPLPPTSLGSRSNSNRSRSDNNDSDSEGSDEGYRGAPYMQKTTSRDNVFTVPPSPGMHGMQDDLEDHMPTPDQTRGGFRGSEQLPGTPMQHSSKGSYDEEYAEAESPAAQFSPERSSSRRTENSSSSSPSRKSRGLGWFGRKKNVEPPSDEEFEVEEEELVEEYSEDEERHGNAPVYNEEGEYVDEQEDDFDDEYIPAHQRSRRTYRREMDREADERANNEHFHKSSGSLRSGRSYRSNRSPREKHSYTDDYSEGMEEGRSRQYSRDGTSITFIEEQHKRERKYMFMLGGCLICTVLALALLVGGVIGATILGDNGTDSSPTPSTPATPSSPSTPSTPAAPTTPKPPTDPSPSPPDGGGGEQPVTTQPPLPATAAPTQPGEITVADPALYDLVAGSSLDGGLSISSRDSPQNLAYKWLESDPVQASGITDARKLQRYALATYYYSTNGDSWLNNLGWLGEADECLWFNDAGTFACSGENLVVLEMKLNNVAGSLPPELHLLTDLTRIAISNEATAGPGLTGGIPKELGKLTLLKEFELEGHSFTEALPAELFQDWTVLDTIQIVASGVPGPIPTTVGNLAAATRLNFQRNALTGAIPGEIGQLDLMLQFDLSENELSGPIPPETGDMAQVKGIYFNGNDLTGALPDQLGQLMSIKAGLDFSNNKLSGTIPPSIGTLPEMKMFLVNNNGLTGPIPDFSALENLRNFRIDGNSLTGEVPAGTCAAIDLKGAESYADCPAPVTCTCCSHCCDSEGNCSPNV